jgi:hypothetical protein
VQAAREATRRAVCGTNLKQVALAMHNFHDVHKTLPEGNSLPFCCYGTWQVLILPYVEEGVLAGLYQSYGNVDGLGVTYYSEHNLSRVTSKHLATFTCPSDNPNNVATSGWPGGNPNVAYQNYVVNYGNTALNAPEQTLLQVPSLGGVLFQGAPFYKGNAQRFKDITDGTSKTLLASELIQGQGNDLRGLTYWDSGSGFVTYLRPNDSQPDMFWADNSWCNPNPPNPPCVPWSSQQMWMMGARSQHPGGVQVALCDGSNQFVADAIDINVWRALSTSQGAELTPPFD